MQRLAREFTPRATKILRDIADDPTEDGRNRIVAIGMLYDRAWGKPKEYDAKAEATAEEEEDTEGFRASDHTLAELEVIRDAARLLLEARARRAASRARSSEAEAEILLPRAEAESYDRPTARTGSG
jgi:hypothetical protein